MRFCNQRSLNHLASTRKPEHYMEVGVMSGGSVEIVLNAWHPASLTLCDWWNPAYRGAHYTDHQHVVQLLEGLGYRGKVHYLDGDSHVRLKSPALPRNYYGLIHIDGDHSYEGALDDIRDCWGLLAPGGYVVVDDLIHTPEVLRAIKTFLSEVPECLEVCRDTVNPNGCGVLTKPELGVL